MINLSVRAKVKYLCLGIQEIELSSPLEIYLHLILGLGKLIPIFQETRSLLLAAKQRKQLHTILNQSSAKKALIIN